VKSKKQFTPKEPSKILPEKYPSILIKQKKQGTLSKQVSFDSNSTKCVDMQMDTIFKNQKYVDLFSEKILQKDDHSQPLSRAQYEKKVIKKLMNLKEPKNVMIDI